MAVPRRIAQVTGLARSAVAGIFDQSQPFGRFALVHVLQAGGTTFVTVSLAGSLFFSISPDAAKSKVLLYLLLTIAPFALVGPALSPLLDRSRRARRSSVAIANVGSGLTCLAMSRNIHDLLLFPEAFCVLVLGKLYLVARAALVPALAPTDHDLASANARLAVLASLAGIVAAPVGVGLLKLGAPWVLRVGAVVFFAGAVASIRLPRPAREPRRHRTQGEVATAQPDQFVMARAEDVARERRLLGLSLYPRQAMSAIAAMSVARASVGFVEFFLAFAFRRMHAGTWWFGLLIGASAAGSLLGSMLVPRLRKYLSERQIILAALGTIVVGGISAAFLGGMFAQAVLTFVVGMGPTGAKPALDSIVQRSFPPALLGRAFGRLETRLQLAWVIAALIAVIIPMPLRIGDLGVALACALGGLAYLQSRARPEQKIALDQSK